MTWSVEGPQGNESGKIRWEIVPWTRGRGLDLGCGPNITFPHFIRVDNCVDNQLFGHNINPNIIVETCEKLDIFASCSMDFVFSSHLLEHIENYPAALKEWMRVIKRNGYLVLYLPDEDEYPKVGEKEANQDHKWNVNYDKVVTAMPDGFDLIDFQKRNQDQEYSLYFVFKKVGSGKHYSWKRAEKPVKTCGIVRYGAYGDLLQASSVFAGLKKQGYHVTLYTSPPGDQTITHDPHVDRIILQDKDQVPNQLLGDFWDHIKKKYDKFVNLSESVEGTMLALPGRQLHGLPPAVRHRLTNQNYLEFQHEIAGVPHDPSIKFYATQEEQSWAKKEKHRIGSPLITWSLAGSSVHKTWSGLDNIIASILLDFPEARIVLVGGESCKLLEQGWENESRVHKKCGVYSIRESLALAQISDLVIGPETGVLNSVACEPMSKVVFLSHSTDENLTRDWINTHILFSEKTTCPGRGNNEALACHQLHYGWSHCKRTENGVAQCQEDISVDQAYRVIWHALYSVEKKVA